MFYEISHNNVIIMSIKGYFMNWAISVKKLREKLLLTQIEFSQFLGVSFGTVNRWENGHYEPTMKQKRKLQKLMKKEGIVK